MRPGKNTFESGKTESNGSSRRQRAQGQQAVPAFGNLAKISCTPFENEELILVDKGEGLTLPVHLGDSPAKDLGFLAADPGNELKVGRVRRGRSLQPGDDDGRTRPWT